MLVESLNKPIDDGSGRTRQQVFVEQLIRLALEGRPVAIQNILDRLDPVARGAMVTITNTVTTQDILAKLDRIILQSPNRFRFSGDTITALPVKISDDDGNGKSL